MCWIDQLPFRLGTTSYIIPDDILPNVRWLAGQVQDIELVLFELDDGSSNLPALQVIDELFILAQINDLSFTVHLPLDLRLGAEGEPQHVSLQKAQKVIARTLPLQPKAYVLHLDGKEVRAGVSDEELRHWQMQSVQTLEIVASWVGGAERLAVENLEGYPLDFLDEVLEQTSVSCCVDIGHLWLDNHDPLPFLNHWLNRTTVVHLHGQAERDHRSLSFIPPHKLDEVLELLCKAEYRGVVTVEVFTQEDFHLSMEALQASFERLRTGGRITGAEHGRKADLDSGWGAQWKK